MPKEQYFLDITWWEQVTIWWDDYDDVRFVLDQQGQSDFDSTISLKQQSVSRHVVPHGNIILISSQPVFALTPKVLHAKRRNNRYQFYSLLLWPDWWPEPMIYRTPLTDGPNPWSTAPHWLMARTHDLTDEQITMTYFSKSSQMENKSTFILSKISELIFMVHLYITYKTWNNLIHVYRTQKTKTE